MNNNKLIPIKKGSLSSYISNNDNYVKPMKKLLCWSDFVGSTTGFGTVSRYILNALYSTGRYEIDQLAINYTGDFYTKDMLPYSIVPAKFFDANDPYGSQAFINALLRKDYDAVFVMNDTHVVENVGKLLEQVRDTKHAQNQKQFNLVYYYPVDCRLLPQYTSMIKEADRKVAYSHFGADMSRKIGIEPTDIIYHGVDVDAFHPLPIEEKKRLRDLYFKADADKFILINVNRNSLRKDLARTLFAFYEFRKMVPNSILYLHTCIIDSGASPHVIDLHVLLEELGFDIAKDVIFPYNYSPAKGFPTNVLNQFYNCADAYISTTLGEGFGLCLDSSTILDTYRGSIKIKDILIGDHVIGCDGKFHQVLDKTCRFVNEIYMLKAMYSPKILVTSEHPFYILKKGALDPQWLNVKQISLDDYIAIPKQTENKSLIDTIDILNYISDDVEYNDQYIWYKMGFSPKTNGLSISDIQKKYYISKRVAEDARRCYLDMSLPSRGLPNSLAYHIAQQIKNDGLIVNDVQLKVNRYIKINNAFLYFIGWYLAEGNNGKGTKLDIDFNITEWNFAQELSEYLDYTFNVVSIVEQHGLHKCRVRLSSGIIAKFMGSICGIHSHNKRIPSFLLQSPQKLGPLLKSLFLGDGNICFNSRSITLSTTSPSLAFQTRYICSANNILVSIIKRPPQQSHYKSIYTCRISTPHIDRWNQFTQQDIQLKEIIRSSVIHFIETDKYFFVPIKKISKLEVDNLPVYDISVENSQSFTANGLLAHNTFIDTMAAGTPAIVPDNTTIPEIFGIDRGYVYPCKEFVYIDNSGKRAIGHMDDILAQMMLCYDDWMAEKTGNYQPGRKNQRQEIIKKARAFTEQYSWTNIGKRWVDLFDSLLPKNYMTIKAEGEQL